MKSTGRYQGAFHRLQGDGQPQVGAQVQAGGVCRGSCEGKGFAERLMIFT